MTTAWDPSNHGLNITLSGSNLIATHAGGDGSTWRLVFADTGRSTGKLYFEILIGALPNGELTQFAFCKNNQNVDSYVGASGDDGWVRADMSTLDGGGDGVVTYATGNRGYTTATTNDVLGFALDLDAGKTWIAKNNSFGGSPGAGTNPAWTWTPGGTWFPVYGSFSALGDYVATLHAVLANQTYPPPTGFTDWDGASPGGGFIAAWAMNTNLPVIGTGTY